MLLVRFLPSQPLPLVRRGWGGVFSTIEALARQLAAAPNRQTVVRFTSLSSSARVTGTS